VTANETSDKQQWQHPCLWNEQLLQQAWDTIIMFCTKKLAGLGDTGYIFIQVLDFYARSCVASRCPEEAAKTVASMMGTVIVPTRQSPRWAVLQELVAWLPSNKPTGKGLMAL